MTAVAFGLTDVGRRRDSNEDEFLVDPDIGLYAVADGMGGHAAGEIASRMAIETLAESLRTSVLAREIGDTLAAAERLRRAVADANRKICESIQRHEERRGMGTTLAAVLTVGDGAVIGHVGDSRVYLLRRNDLHRMTSDHSWVNEQVKMGLLTDDAAQRHPMRNIVTRALGSRQEVAVEIGVERLESGDVLLVCSDGLNTMLADEEIGKILAAHATTPEHACRELITAANERGGEDNVTAVVVRVT